MKKFTFKTVRPTGPYKWLHNPSYLIKFDGRICGKITHTKPHQVRLMVYKDDVMEDGNPNCSWKWMIFPNKLTLVTKFDSVDDAKKWINEVGEHIRNKYAIHLHE